MRVKSKYGFDVDDVVIRAKVDHSSSFESVISVSGLCSKFAEGEEDYNLEVFRVNLEAVGIEFSNIVKGSKKTRTSDYIRLNKSNLDKLEKVINPEYVKDIVFTAHHYVRLNRKIEDLQFVGLKINHIPTFGLPAKELFKVAIHCSPIFFNIDSDIQCICKDCDNRGDDYYFNNPKTNELCLTLPGIRHYLTSSREFDATNLEEIMERASVKKHEYFKIAR